jgi:cytochrome c oxidase subunit 2
MQVSSPLNPATAQSAAISHLFVIVLVVAALILAVVVGLVVFIVLRYRQRDDGREPAQTSGNLTLEVVWTAIPIGILVIIFFFTVKTMHEVSPPVGRRAPDLVVVAHQWWWEVRYPETGVVTANEVHIPTGEHLLVGVESADVIHDFWVPRLARKVDAIPRHPNHLWLQVDEPGTYLGSCNEYCGVGHAQMRLRVIAEPEEEFRAWEDAQLKAPPAPVSAAARQGKLIFQRRTCAACHRIAGSAAAGTVGPDLSHLASRETLASGAAPNTREELARWLADPNSIKPGSHMPNLQLSPAEVGDLVAYLEGLR